MARMALLDQAMPHRCRFRAGSWADGDGMPARVRSSAMAKMPFPAANQAKIICTTSAVSGSISRRCSRLPSAALAGLGCGRMKARHDDLVEALDGMFDDHHGELARLLLDQIAFLDAKITQLTGRIAESAAAIPRSWGVDGDGTTGPDAGTGPDAAVLPAPARLAQIPGL